MRLIVSSEPRTDITINCQHTNVWLLVKYDTIQGDKQTGPPRPPISPPSLSTLTSSFVAQIVLHPPSIYATLFLRGDGTFHWAICVSVDDSNATKMHVTNLSGGWVYEKIMDSIVKSQTACVAVKIGELSSTRDIEPVSNLLENIPMLIPTIDQSIEERFTCRVWFKEAIRVLTANGIISCPDVYKLERELKAYGEEQDPKTVAGYGVEIRTSSILSI
ncbi:hypothetical protein BDY19DRAFT_922981 [Irpex rosettiformis]|uniref:Uncharacterized protein n=1 Tax=Irpex rosettiformis TaxID=378272 RepID=A0ACB8UG80_9APHY|nr:hypothetical protein BDY19DRAFT_922981 [Irpex rosettiformis]